MPTYAREGFVLLYLANAINKIKEAHVICQLEAFIINSYFSFG